METVLAMYGWMHDVCSWISKILELGMVMECCGSYWGLYMGVIIVVCLIYNLLPQQNKKIINL